MSLPNQPYRHALVLSGGGLRFGYQLGAYQAFYERMGVPDVVLASCGGAFSAALLSLDSRPSILKALLSSRTCYEMFCRIYARQARSLTDYLTPALKRYLTYRWRPTHHLASALHADILDELQSSLFDIDGEPNTPLWQQSDWQKQWRALCHSPSNNQHHPPQSVRTLIISSQLIPTPKPHWQEVLSPFLGGAFDDVFAQTLHKLTPNSTMATHNPLRINKRCAILPLPLSVAVRASISDMYYLPLTYWQDQALMGGVLNLMPIDHAKRLADTVFIDDKSPYDTLLASPAIASVFGFDANHVLNTLKHTHPHNANMHWLPLADVSKHTKPILAKQYRYFAGDIGVIYPSFDEFIDIVQSQWRYGYERSTHYFESLSL
ncbi:MAG: patatin-like phospholipase family protein [Moraxella sp.]|nr:patatin-like phospholipase family protein [Moraxella sp.]